MLKAPSELDDPNVIRLAAGALETCFTHVATRAEQIRSTWSSLAVSYEAPGDEIVHSAMDKPDGYARTVAAHAATMRQALETYASELDSLVIQRASIMDALAELYPDQPKRWFFGPPYVYLTVDIEAEEDVLSLIIDFETRLEEAQRTCGNALNATWGGPQFLTTGETNVDNPHVYGTTERIKYDNTRSGESPWGSPEGWRIPDPVSGMALMGRGAISSLWDSAVDLYHLAGGPGTDPGVVEYTRSGTIKSLTTTAVSLFNGTIGCLYLPFMGASDEVGKAWGHLGNVMKEMVSWDTWGTDTFGTTGSLAVEIAKAALGMKFMKVLGKVSPTTANSLLSLINLYDHAKATGMTKLKNLVTLNLGKPDLDSLRNLLHPSVNRSADGTDIPVTAPGKAPGPIETQLSTSDPHAPRNDPPVPDRSKAPYQELESGTAPRRASDDEASTDDRELADDNRVDAEPPRQTEPNTPEPETVELHPLDEAPRAGTQVTPGSQAPTYDHNAPVRPTESPTKLGIKYTDADVQRALDNAPRNKYGQPVDHRNGRPLILERHNGYRGWHMRWDPVELEFVAENPSLKEHGLPLKGPEGGFGYDDQGNLLPYANHRPSYLAKQVAQVWKNVRDKLLADIASGQLDLPNDLGPNEMWVRTLDNATGDNIHIDPDGQRWRRISWEPGQPRKGLWDMGHIREEAYAKLRYQYLSHEITLDDFLKAFHDPKNYTVQDPMRNQSHIDE